MSDIVERLLETKSEYGVQTRLVDRLRGKYASGPHLPNGKPEFGWRQFEAPPIQHEAATAIEELAAEITRLRSLLKEAGDALEAIVARWDTPAWKDTEPTAEVINRARTVRSKIKGDA